MQDPSTSPPGLEPEGLFTGVSPWAVVVGGVTDYIATLFGTGVLLGALGGEAVAGGGKPAARALEQLAGDPSFVAAMMALGALCTVLGGFVAARRAGVYFVKHGGFVGAASIVLALVSFASAPEQQVGPSWATVAGFLLAIPAGMAGGALAETLAAARAPDADDPDASST